MPDRVAPSNPAPAAAAPTDALFATLYGELRRLAQRQMAREGDRVALGATTLLHEAYLDMSARHALDFPDKYRFLAYAARVMRALIIDHVRAAGAQKRGGAFDITSLDTEFAQEVAEPELLSRISGVLDELAVLDPRLAQVVDLKFFCGFSLVEIAALQDVSERTVQRQWEKARAMLYGSLVAGDADARRATRAAGA